MKTIWLNICKQIGGSTAQLNLLIEAISSAIVDDLRDERKTWLRNQAVSGMPHTKDSTIALIMEDLMTKSSDEFISFTQNYKGTLEKWTEERFRTTVWPKALTEGRAKMSAIITSELSKLDLLNSDERIEKWISETYSGGMKRKVSEALDPEFLKVQSKNLYEVFAPVRNLFLKDECEKKFQKYIEGCGDLTNLLRDVSAKYIKEHCGCLHQCPFCGAICHHHSPDHNGKHSTKFHTMEAFRCNQVWKGAAFFVTCYYQIEVKWPFTITENGMDKRYNYGEYENAGPPYSTWNIDKSAKTKQLLWYDFMARKYRKEICTYMNAGSSH